MSICTPNILRDLTATLETQTLEGPGLYRQVWRWQAPALTIQPGQFLMLSVSTQTNSGLDPWAFRRPFSLLEQPDPQTLSLLYKVVGQGTQLMSQWQPGHQTQLLAPLGGGYFPALTPDSVLVGGGIGVAPLFFALSQYPKNLPLPYFVYGAQNKAAMGSQLVAQLEARYAQQPERLLLVSEAGDTAHAGRVTHFLEPLLAQTKQVWTCGPMAMMRAVTQQVHACQSALPVYVSLEEPMPCGVGACTGCVVPVIDPIITHPLPVKSCLEGPVFLASRLNWPCSA